MKRRQTSVPRQWLIVDARLSDDQWRALRRLQPGSGVLILSHGLPANARERLIRRLRHVAVTRRLRLFDENKAAARVHNLNELRRALLARTPMILLSPIHRTRSHPDWQPIPRLRAAAYARLAARGLVALGGMDERRFRRIERLGFVGWAGIDAWITRLSSQKSRDEAPIRPRTRI
jgi:thiamine-phosphate pyrophosphorylase